MRSFFFYTSSGLLVAAAILSALIDNWTVLAGVAIGLGSALTFLWISGGNADYDAETRRAREALIGPKPSQTTYYYDVASDSEQDGDDEKRRL